MIRTYDTNGASVNFYKLYSSSQMTVPGGSFVPGNEVPTAAWTNAANADIYTDLNAPCYDAAGENLCSRSSTPRTDGTPTITGTTTNTFKVDGFSVTSPPGYNAGSAISLDQ